METFQSIPSLIDKEADNQSDITGDINDVGNTGETEQAIPQSGDSSGALDVHILPEPDSTPSNTQNGVDNGLLHDSNEQEDEFQSSEEHQPEEEHHLDEEQPIYTKRTSSKIDTRPTSLLVHDLDTTAARGASEPHALVIASLRAQIDELTSQLNSLNAKLVLTFDKSDNLQHELDSTHQHNSRLQAYIAQLEKERAAVKQSLDNGTLVERENVMQELTRMVDSIVTETQKATLARQDKAAIEQDLDDLSANLFGEANRMVGVERLLKAQEIERRKIAEERLAEAEEAVRLTQVQMNEWVERAEKGVVVSGGGVRLPPPAAIPHTLSDTHIPYLEFTSYLSALANLSVRQAQAKDTPLPPLDLGHAFLRRVLEEDIEPTLRLDLSRAFGLLTRGKVLSAIVEGSLELEPAAKDEFGAGTECALSGRLLIPEKGTNAMHKASSSQSSSSLFGFRSNRSITALPPPPIASCANIYVFRLSTAPGASRYPVDPTWALPRLRAACEFWRYVRTLQMSIVALDGPFKPPLGCQTLKGVEYGVGEAHRGSEDKRATKSFWGSFGRLSQPASPSPLANPPVALPDVESENKEEVEKEDTNGKEHNNCKEDEQTNVKEDKQTSNDKEEKKENTTTPSHVVDQESNENGKAEQPQQVMSAQQQPPPKPKRGRKGRGRKGTVTGAPPPIPSEQVQEVPEVPEVPKMPPADEKEEKVEKVEEEKAGKSDTVNTSNTPNTLDLQLNNTPQPTETWEMARWRQVLELKHNMFWARVNGDPSASVAGASASANEASADTNAV